MGKYEITLGGFSAEEANSPIEAARNIAKFLMEGDNPMTLIYDVKDEETGKKFTVDLSDETCYETN